MTIARPVRNPTRPKTRRWTLKEYYRLADLGFFQDQRVELIDGKIYQMPALNNPQMVAHEKCRRALQQMFGAAYWIRYQGPLHILGSAPEPDLAVVPGLPDDYKNHPTSALLIVEVSDTTLHIDRWKGNLYAASGTDYWILDLNRRRLEVRRGPVADPSVKQFGHRYSAISIYTPADSIAPLALPQPSVRVGDLLP
jgi:Uma2 family endonuclease